MKALAKTVICFTSVFMIQVSYHKRVRKRERERGFEMRQSDKKKKEQKTNTYKIGKKH